MEKIVDLDATLHAETELARGFKFDDDQVDLIWIPKSQHEWDEHDWVVSMPENVAIEKGLV